MSVAVRANGHSRDATACGVLLAGALLSAVLPARALSGGQEVAVRVLPRAASTNHAALRLGLRAGLLEGPGNPFRAECFLEGSLGAEGRVSVKTVPDPDTGRKRFLVTNDDGEMRGVALTTRPLRRGVGHTVRVSCRRVKGRGRLRFVFAPVGGTPEEATQKSASLNGDDVVETSFAVVPHKDGMYRCAFEVEPSTALELCAFSMVPDDAEGGWDAQVLEALRAVRPGTLTWPSQQGLGFYNWYDGVGPRALRRSVSPTARAEDGHDFGTLEFVGFCRLIGAEPVMRVTVCEPGARDGRAAAPADGVQLAADWVAYCNATGGHPLALLRTRHGHAAPLGVRRWELATAQGGVPDAAVCGAYAAAMRAEDPEADVRAAPAVLPRLEDRYVAKVLRRLSEGDAADRSYYGEWYAALGMAYAALDRLGRGEGGAVCTAFHPEQILYRVTYAKNMLAEAGLLMALFNRFPAGEPLVTESVPTEEADGPFRARAAWTEDRSALMVFIYNSGPEARAVRLELTGMRRRFAFWVADQLAADITVRRASQALPINRIQKAGAAISQVVLFEAAPSSFTRVIVKE